MFSTSLTTLLRVKDSFFSAMFDGRFGNKLDEHGCYFIDRDGSNFSYILNYLRDGSIVLPENMHFCELLLREAEYYQIPGLIQQIKCNKARRRDYVTVRYLPGSTYDGWPMRLEGPVDSSVISELNGGDIPPEKDGDPKVRNMYGTRLSGWKIRGMPLTKVFIKLSNAGWILKTSNGSGAGTNNFAEMYVFIKEMISTVLPEAQEEDVNNT